MLCDANGTRTSSGIIVADRDDSVYMTAAAHGFSGIGSKVYHPDNESERNVIGKIVCELGDVNGTDVALVRLGDDIRYDNTPFIGGNEDPRTHDPLPIQAFSLDPLIGTRIAVNTPFSGYAQGIILAKRTMIVKGDTVADSSSEEYEYCFDRWDYWGTGFKGHLDGSCGAPVVDRRTGEVTSLFRSVGKDGVGRSLSMQSLADLEVRYVGRI